MGTLDDSGIHFDPQEMVSSSTQRPIPQPEEVPDDRFHTPVNEETLEAMGRKRFADNTERKVTWAAQMYRDWRNFRLMKGTTDPRIVSADIDCLTKLDKVSLSYALSNFIMEVKKCDGMDFPGQTLYQIVICLQFFLETQGHEWKLVDDPVFIRFKNTLDNTMKERAKAGLGWAVSATPITLSDEDKMWQEGVLGEDEPETLRDTVVFLLGLNFVLCGGLEQRNLRRPGFKPQVTVQVDSSGQKYLQYIEDTTSKTNQGGLNNRRTQPKEARVYGSDDPLRNVVRLYEKYTNLLPSNGRHPSLYK